MALLFDHFGTRRVQMEVVMWPGFGHGFKTGELSALYGVLNTDDLFESCELRANVGAEFESEHWRYDISTTRILVSSEAFQSFDDLDKQVSHLLEETKRFLTPQRVPFLITESALVRGVIPEGTPDRDVGAVLRSKILARRLSKGEPGESILDLLPGRATGIGMELVGDTETYHWHANIGPTHEDGRSMPISARLYFPPPLETPEASMISDSLRTAYEFLTMHVLTFAKQALA